MLLYFAILYFIIKLL